jgi:hypothetical protein
MIVFIKVHTETYTSDTFSINTSLAVYLKTPVFPRLFLIKATGRKNRHHWLIADQMAMMEQLGVMNVPA